MSKAARAMPEMTPERWRQVRNLLATAIRLCREERPAFFDQVCQDDASLRAELESLLSAHDIAELGRFEPPASAATASEVAIFARPDRFMGRRIGAYHVENEIARGGMGTVFRAVRADDRFQKQVAIKILDAPIVSSHSLALFRHEREILAGLEHPNIARLLDAGETDDGVPYFVMEYVEGECINKYCAAQRLTVEERLTLFLKLCSAVHYAHQRLVIHRDLKPANILVTATAEPKLLDFGIAKLTEASSAAGMATASNVMTPAYASPEQICGQPITTASDTYSLGLVLYELLTGRYAYCESLTAIGRQRSIILELDPAKPSQAVLRDGQTTTTEEISGTLHLTPECLSRRLRGDLESIVLKAIRKEPLERYASVAEFADDIRRHLAGLPVIAHKDSFDYRVRKFVKRYKTAVLAAALVVVSLVTGIAMTVHEKRIAQRRFNDLRRLANSLMFEVHDSIRDLPGATGARKLIVQRAQEYLDSLARESKSDPALLRELAAAYSRLASVQGNSRDTNVGDTRKAVQNYRKAAELLEADAALEPSNREARLELAQIYINLGICLWRAGDKAGKKEITQKALGVLEDLAASNPNDQKTQALLGEAYAQAGFGFAADNDVNQALNYHEKALRTCQLLTKIDPKNDEYQTQLAFSHKRVAGVLIEQNRLPEALEHERAALAIDEAQLALHPNSGGARYNITFTYSDTGYILGTQGYYDAALSYYEKAREIRAALVAADPQDTRAKEGLANTHSYIAWNLRQKGDFVAALDSYKKGLAIRDALSEKDPANEPLRFKIALSQTNIGDVYAAMAFRPGVAPADQLACCRQSENWIRRGLPMWLRMKTEGKLVPSDVEAFPRISQNLVTCGRIIGAAGQAGNRQGDGP